MLSPGLDVVYYFKSGLLSLLGCSLLSLPSTAQLIPDNTLGAESSQVIPNAEVRGLPADLIQGGATRGVNLYHSFRDFNVGDLQRVYFANPTGIENILTRVTGGNPSNIFGTLGVEGPASLFLLNPNGILFGANAQLDVAGSFTASTADSFRLPDGSQFSATNPQAPPLLTVSITPGLQYGNTNPAAVLTNRANLAAGSSLTLQGGKLDLQGQIQSGADLNLIAQDSLTIRDRDDQPFIALAGKDLLIQGNQQVDIFALNHPESGLFSGGDLTVRSANPAIGDARYTSGGNVRIEQLDGSLGDLISPNDPVIRANGDVAFISYTGASLHIFAGGSVKIVGFVTITGADPSNGITETVPLSRPLPDGTNTLAIDGRSQPTLDIRAGTNAVGTPGNQGTPPPNLTTTPNPSNADITLNQVIFEAENGLVFLSNQYQPNSLPGTISLTSIDTRNVTQSGTVVIDARGNLDLGDLRTDALQGSTTNAGDISLIARGAVTLETRALLQARTLGSGNAGNITVLADSLTMPNQAQLDTSTTATGNGGNLTIRLSNGLNLAGTNTRLLTLVSGNADATGGDIDIQAGSLSITAGAAIINAVRGTGTAGDITLDIAGNVLIDGVGNGSNSSVFAGILSGGEGQGGDLTLSAQFLTLSDGGVLATATFGEGDAGDLTVKVRDRILLTDVGVDKTIPDQGTGTNPTNSGFTLIGSELQIGAEVQILSVSPVFTESAPVTAIVSESEVEFPSTQSLFAPNSSSFFGFQVIDSTIDAGADYLEVNYSREASTGTFANILKNNGVFTFTNPIALQITNVEIDPSSTLGIAPDRITFVGNKLTINYAGVSFNPSSVLRINLSGTVTDSGLPNEAAKVNLPIGGVSSPSGLYAGVSSPGLDSAANSRAGQITIVTTNLQVQNGARINTDATLGDAGNITIRATDTVTLINGNQDTITASGVNGGAIDLTTGQLQMQNNVAIGSVGIGGNSSDITIQASQGITASNGSSIQTSAVSDPSENRVTSGNVQVTSPTLSLQESSLISSRVLGLGTVGNVTVQSPVSVTLESNSGISTLGTGDVDGGNLNLTTDDLTLDGGTIGTNAIGIRQIGGDLSVTAETITLRNGSINTAAAGAGTGGNLTITADRIALTEDSNFSSGSIGSGSGSNLNIATRDLTISSRSTITTSSGDVNLLALTFNDFLGNAGANRPLFEPIFADALNAALNAPQGEAGALTVQASESVTIANNGVLSTVSQGNTNSGSLTVETGNLTIRDTGLLISSINGEGRAGDISLTANNLSVTSQGEISSRGLCPCGEGDAANISIVLNSDLNLNAGAITATSFQAGGGDIAIRAEDVRLRQGSLISTSVFDSDGGGGNISINSDVFLALENSDILANAEQGPGGVITINSPGFLADLFGTGQAEAVGKNPGSFDRFRGNSRVDISAFFRPGTVLPPDIPIVETVSGSFGELPGNSQVDISVASALGESGTLNLPNVDPGRGLTELPVGLSDPSNQISQRCVPGSRVAQEQTEDENRFIITGRGGIPASPLEPLSPDGVVVPWVELDETDGNGPVTQNLPATSPNQPNQIVEAQRWVKQADGTVRLVADRPDVAPELARVTCVDDRQAMTP